jgi:hypothetical protein
MNQLDGMMNNPKFRDALANDPQVSQYIAQNTNPEDLTQIEGGGDTNQRQSINPFEGILGIGLLKTLAKRYV